MNNKTCVLAWRGLHVTPDEGVSMCCTQSPLTILGDQKIIDIRTSQEWNDIRQSMLDGDEHQSCKQCWDLEKEGIVKSPREYINNTHPTVEMTNAILEDDKVYQIDIRQSNICNMKCLSCFAGLSSMIAAEEAKENNIKSKGIIEIVNNDLENYVMNNIANVREIYFAGGEPLINPLHWKILRELDRIGRYDEHVVYNTNLSKLDYKGTHVFDYWNKFSNWYAGVSIDAIGARAEYVRAGTVWKSIDKNLKQMQQLYPARFGIDTTVSALNAGALIELMDDLDSRGIRKHRWYNYVYQPTFLHVSVLPLYYREHLVDVMAEKKGTDDTGFMLFKNQMINNELATSKDKQDFKQYIQHKDNIRGTNIFESCPEFIDLWDDIK
jgi:MoaA/NifB/PqqE/SkfB family radical SAM enzyme